MTRMAGQLAAGARDVTSRLAAQPSPAEPGPDSTDWTTVIAPRASHKSASECFTLLTGEMLAREGQSRQHINGSLSDHCELFRSQYFAVHIMKQQNCICV